MRELEILDGDFSICEMIVILLLNSSMAHSIRFSKAVVLSPDSYIFWCWSYNSYSFSPEFIFGQLLFSKKKINWDYKTIEYKKWARTAYKKGWFEKENVGPLMIGHRNG